MNIIWCYFQLSAKWKKGTKSAIILMRYSKKPQLALQKSNNTHPHRTTAQGELCSSLCSACHTTENFLKHWILHEISMVLLENKILLSPSPMPTSRTTMPGSWITVIFLKTFRAGFCWISISSTSPKKWQQMVSNNEIILEAKLILFA